MAHSARYRVQVRRRREGKTDYRARKGLVLSGKPRLVVRRSIKNVTAQIVVAKTQGDQILAMSHSSELRKKYDWKAPTGNIPSAYLVGLICGLKAKKIGVTEAVLDIGLIAPTKGSKLFAVLSGVVDAGILIPYNEEKIVKERTQGEHIIAYAEELTPSSEDYSAKFSKYIGQGIAPEKLGEHFEKVKTNILNSFKSEVKKDNVKRKRTRKANH